MIRIAFITLGCKLNYAETSTYERHILAGAAETDVADAGVNVVGAGTKADIYLVNTCSVTEHADKKCRNIIRKLHRTSPEAAIFVTGCYAELKRADIEAIEGVRAVFGAKEKPQVVPTILQYIAALPATAASGGAATGDGIAAGGVVTGSAVTESAGVGGVVTGSAVTGSAVTGSAVTEDTESSRVEAAKNGSMKTGGAEAEIQCRRVGMFPAYSSGERTRSFLKVQDGCDFRCSYCTVPDARGASRNIPIAQVIAQAREIAGQGIREIVLTGVNTGDFGKTTGESFFDLIRQLNEVDGIERYRISSIEPNLLTEEMVDWIASGTKFLPHFHIPLQSGSDTILRAMGRRYDTAAFALKIDRIRSAMERGGRSPVFFGIDVIVGFPGETEELFEQTYTFLRDRIHPAFIHIFPYSRRPGTPAAARKDQVQDRIKTGRVERLEELCSTLHSQFIAANRGRAEKVLFESSDKNGKMFGYTGNYIRVERPFDPTSVGRIVDVII